jgi:hypothetical protein
MATLLAAALPVCSQSGSFQPEPPESSFKPICSFSNLAFLNQNSLTYYVAFQFTKSSPQQNRVPVNSQSPVFCQRGENSASLFAIALKKALLPALEFFQKPRFCAV